MMRATASVHVNLDVAGIEDGAQRWRLVHALGPTLCAVFANSAIARGKPTGWKSSRLALWQAIDPSRTLPTAPVGDPVHVWSAYALQARVMFIRNNDTAEHVAERLTFADWLESGHPLGFPDLSDLKIHLTTLFPPIRPKGWLELRMVDALPDPWWRVPIAIASMVYDRKAVRIIEEVVEPTADLWEVAARQGMENQLLSETGQAVFNAALDALERLEVDEETALAVEAYNRSSCKRAAPRPTSNWRPGPGEAACWNLIRWRTHGRKRACSIGVGGGSPAVSEPGGPGPRGRPAGPALADNVPAGLGPCPRGQLRGDLAAKDHRRSAGQGPRAGRYLRRIPPRPQGTHPVEVARPGAVPAPISRMCEAGCWTRWKRSS